VRCEAARLPPQLCCSPRACCSILRCGAAPGRRGAGACRAPGRARVAGATQPHQWRLGPQPALSRTRRAQRSGRGSRTLLHKSATRAGAHAPRKTPLLCARPIPPPLVAVDGYVSQTWSTQPCREATLGATFATRPSAAFQTGS
jgi:hypothetical protein